MLNRTIEKHGMVLKLATDGCMDTQHQVNYLEHVQVRISLTYSRRGDLQLHLLSPSGTPSTLLPRRKDDYQPGKLDAWHFLSVFYWGERPNGTWTLILENIGSELNSGISRRNFHDSLLYICTFGQNSDSYVERYLFFIYLLLLYNFFQPHKSFIIV